MKNRQSWMKSLFTLALLAMGGLAVAQEEAAKTSSVATDSAAEPAEPPPIPAAGKVEPSEIPKMKPSDIVQILFTHDGMGELEPCGCRANPLGGVIRRSALTERLKKEFPKTFSVETGNSFFENLVTPPALKNALGFQSEKIAESFRLFPLRAFVPGEKDFSLGYAHLKKLKKLSQTPFLAANLVDRQGTAPFTKTLSDPVGMKKKLLWVGLVGTDLALPSELKATDPIAALRKILGRKEDPNRIVVILSALGMEKDRELVSTFPEIALVIGSRDQALTQSPVRVEGRKALILQTSYRNQHLGRVKINLENGATESELIALDETFDADPAPKARALIEEWKSGIARITSLEEKIEGKAVVPGGKSHQDTFPRCAQCHQEVFNFWRKTNHASALKPLRKKNLLTHPSCLKCHTVSTDSPPLEVASEGPGEMRRGSWEETAFLMDEITGAEKMESPIRLFREGPPKPMGEALGDLETVRGSVQCLNCHQSEGNHPFEGQITKTVSEATCLKCHTREQAPAWYGSDGLKKSVFAENLKKVQCPSPSAHVQLNAHPHAD